MRLKWTQLAVSLLAVTGASAPLHAVISYTTSGGSISENFDSLAQSGATNTWTNDTTLPGWFAYRQPVGSETAIPTYAAGTGSSTTGAIYSYGVAGVNPVGDRSLGGLASGNTYWGTPGPASGAVAGWWAVAITNNTGSTLTDFTVNFDGEQWRNGGNTSAQTMVMEYGYGASFTSVSWTAPGGAFNFISLQNTSTAAALDGNAAANRTAGLGGTVGAQTWSPGATLWIRWIENNDVGNDHGMGIDNWGFSAVPAPGAIALFGMGGLVASRRRR